MPYNERYTPEQVKRFRERLISARQSRSLTQVEAAEEIGVSQALVSSLEHGPSAGMRVGELFKVLSFYGIQPNEVADILGYAPNHIPRRADDPRVRRILQLLDVAPITKLDNIIEALALMVKGALLRG